MTQQENQAVELDAGTLPARFDAVDPGIDLRDVFRILIDSRRTIFLAAAIGGLLGSVYAFLLPNMYTAAALILPPAKAQSISSVMLGQLGGMAGALAPSLGLKDAGEMYIGIMKSRSVVDELIDQFHLQREYRATTREGARRKLLSVASFTAGREAMIKISVQDRNAERAAELTNAFISGLDKQNRRLAISESAQRRLFFEREVESEKSALVRAEGSLSETQLRTGVVQASGQAQVVIASIAQMRGGIAMREMALQRLRTGATPQNTEVVRQEAELTSMRAALSRLEAGGGHQISGDPLVPVTSIPKAGLDYMRALREVKYHEALFEMLSKQYETARIDEAKEAPVIQVIDYAEPPEVKSGPPRAGIALLGSILLGVMATVHALLRAGLGEVPTELGERTRARVAAQ